MTDLDPTPLPTDPAQPTPESHAAAMSQPDGTAQPTRRIVRVEVDRDLCIGATTCVAVSPDVFEMDDENKAIVKDPTADTDDNILEAARACPVAAIFLYDAEGKQIYP